MGRTPDKLRGAIFLADVQSIYFLFSIVFGGVCCKVLKTRVSVIFRLAVFHGFCSKS